MRMVVLLSRRHRLYAGAAGWKMPGVELFLFDSPSEALAKVSLGRTAVFVFDTRDYQRHRHVVRKFLSMRVDADLLLVGDEAGPDTEGGTADAVLAAPVTTLPAGSEPAEVFQAVDRLLRLRRVRESSGIVGRSPAIQEVLSLVAHAAPLDVNILILGESGTGKSVVARAVHQRSDRASKPFVTVNCPSLSKELLESELFGHVKGSFTGAVRDHWGKVKAAEGGTLFLDEIGELPLEIQPKLLRLLQDREYERLGENTIRTSQVRIIAATNRDLAACVAEGTFREDLYYRLNVIGVRIPSLRERPEDLVALAEQYLQFFSRQFGRKIKGFSPAARKILVACPWPGNLRELRNVIERAVILCRDTMLQPEDFPASVSGKHSPAEQSLSGHANQVHVGDPVSLDLLERHHIQEIVRRSPSLASAAEVLGIDQATLYRKRKKYESEEAAAQQAAAH